MSLSHHPSEALLLDYALGSLAEGWSLAVSAHLSLCPMCRQQVAEMEALGGALMHECPPAIAGDDLWQRVAARMDAADCLARAALGEPPHLRNVIISGSLGVGKKLAAETLCSLLRALGVDDAEQLVEGALEG